MTEPAGQPVDPPAPWRLRSLDLAWGSRTYVMGIINLTPDSFSGDGLTAGADPLPAALRQAHRMVAEGADILDVGGESTRPGHVAVGQEEELSRVVGAVANIRAVLPGTPISIDTTKPAVAEAALDAGADLVNDVSATWGDGSLAALAARRGVPCILMHGRPRPEYRSVVAEVMADLAGAIERAVRLGCAWESLMVDPGIGFGKTPEQNLRLLRDLQALRALGRPVLLGASRKSTIGRVLDLPPGERLEGTLATTALAVASGADMVRVHDVRANVRAARMSDAIVRGGWQERAPVTGA